MYRRSPSPVNLCPVCAEECLPTKLGVLEHTAKHLEWEAMNVHGGLTRHALRGAAWHAYATALEDENRRLRVDVRDRDDIIEGLEATMDALHRQEAQ